ncbi:hypothetical protein ACLOJK_030550 [Asimina triloba]
MGGMDLSYVACMARISRSNCARLGQCSKPRKEIRNRRIRGLRNLSSPPVFNLFSCSRPPARLSSVVMCAVRKRKAAGTRKRQYSSRDEKKRQRMKGAESQG